MPDPENCPSCGSKTVVSCPGGTSIKPVSKKVHTHGDVCETFADALRWGLLTIINDEVQMKGQLPEGATAGNILTNETYDPKEFMMNIVLQFCPFCGVKLPEWVNWICTTCLHEW